MKINKVLLTSLASICGIMSVNLSMANSKVIDNISQQEEFTWEGNLKLTNSKLHTVVIKGTSHLYNNEFASNVLLEGNTELKENSFNDFLNIVGNIKSENNNYNNNLDVRGTFKDKDSHFYNDLKVVGKVSLENSELDQTLEVQSNDVKIINGKVNKIIYHGPSENDTVNLYLKKNTIVTGSITFQNSTGRVHADESVTINGDVIGGVVIVKNSKSE